MKLRTLTFVAAMALSSTLAFAQGGGAPRIKLLSNNVDFCTEPLMSVMRRSNGRSAKALPLLSSTTLTRP
jgi:hypothetical protein